MTSTKTPTSPDSSALGTLLTTFDERLKSLKDEIEKETKFDEETKRLYLIKLIELGMRFASKKKLWFQNLLDLIADHDCDSKPGVLAAHKQHFFHEIRHILHEWVQIHIQLAKLSKKLQNRFRDAMIGVGIGGGILVGGTVLVALHLIPGVPLVLDPVLFGIVGGISGGGGLTLSIASGIGLKAQSDKNRLNEVTAVSEVEFGKNLALTPKEVTVKLDDATLEVACSSFLFSSYFAQAVNQWKIAVKSIISASELQDTIIANYEDQAKKMIEEKHDGCSLM